MPGNLVPFGMYFVSDHSSLGVCVWGGGGGGGDNTNKLDLDKGANFQHLAKFEVNYRPGLTCVTALSVSPKSNTKRHRGSPLVMCRQFFGKQSK